MQTSLLLFGNGAFWFRFKIQHVAHSSHLFSRFLLMVDLKNTVCGKDIRKERVAGNQMASKYTPSTELPLNIFILFPVFLLVKPVTKLVTSAIYRQNPLLLVHYLGKVSMSKTVKYVLLPCRRG